MSQTVQQILTQQDKLLERIAQIRVMERGTVSRQSYPERARRKQGKGAAGPYCLWQGTVNGKRFGKRVSGPQAEPIEADIARRHEFEELCEQYIDLSCRLSARMAEEKACEQAVKKKLASKSKRAKK